MRTCEEVGCDSAYLAKGHCAKHYHQFRRYGCLQDGVDRRNKPKTLASLFDCTKQVGDCKLWFKSCTDSGYGVTRYEGKQQLAHRVVFKIAHRPDIDGVPIHHKCGNKKCIEPSHLQLATDASNNLEMLARKGYKAEIEMLKTKVSELEARLAVYEEVN